MSAMQPTNPVIGKEPIVYIVDDDAPLRQSLGSLLRSIGLQVHLFDSVAQFMNHPRPDLPSCLVLDVRLQGNSGLECQRAPAAAKGKPIRRAFGRERRGQG